MNYDQTSFAKIKKISGDWRYGGTRLREGSPLPRSGKLRAGSTDARLVLLLTNGDVVGLRGASLSVGSGGDEFANIPAAIGLKAGEPGSSATYINLESGSLFARLTPVAVQQKRMIGVVTNAFQFNLQGGEAFVLDVKGRRATVSVVEGSLRLEEPFPGRGLWHPQDLRAGYRATATADRVEPQRALSAEELSRLENGLRF